MTYRELIKRLNDEIVEGRIDQNDQVGIAYTKEGFEWPELLVVRGVEVVDGEMSIVAEHSGV